MKKLLILLLISALLIAGCQQNDTTTDDTDDTDTDTTDTTNDTSSDTTDTTTDDTTPLLVGPSAIDLNNQQPGQTVEVKTLLMEEPGFVVIHESQNGIPGKIIGESSLLDKDDTETTITLDRTTVDGEGLIAMLHKDNGNGTFDENEDMPVKDNQGEDVMMEFKISL